MKTLYVFQFQNGSVKRWMVKRMSRLIDADAIKLEKGFFENIDNVPKFFEWLGKQPTIDAVEVVRCRDCIHNYICGENVRYNVCERNHNKVQSDEWFCADGQRRRENE